MSKNGNQKQVCVKFVRYFSVDKGSYSEEDLGKIVESNAIRMGKQLLICSEEHAKGSMLEPCGNLAVVAVNDAEEIKILRDYIKTRVDNMFTEVRE